MIHYNSIRQPGRNSCLKVPYYQFQDRVRLTGPAPFYGLEDHAYHEILRENAADRGDTL